jgi:hypothetical protein
MTLAFAMHVRRLNTELPTDFLKRQTVAVNAQTRHESEVGWLIRLFASQATLQGLKAFGACESVMAHNASRSGARPKTETLAFTENPNQGPCSLQRVS